MEEVPDALATVLHLVLDPLPEVVDAQAGAPGGVSEGVPYASVREVFAGVPGVQCALAGVSDGVPEALAGVPDGVPEALAGVPDGVPDALAGVPDGVPEALAGVPDRVPDGVPEALAGVPDPLVKVPNGSLLQVASIYVYNII